MNLFAEKLRASASSIFSSARVHTGRSSDRIHPTLRHVLRLGVVRGSARAARNHAKSHSSCLVLSAPGSARQNRRFVSHGQRAQWTWVTLSFRLFVYNLLLFHDWLALLRLTDFLVFFCRDDQVCPGSRIHRRIYFNRSRSCA